MEGAADNLFSSPPRPQPLHFEALSIKIPRNVPPTPGTALQNKIENRSEKSLGNTFNIQLKQEMGLFQASILDAMKSLRDEMLALQNKESGVDKTSNSAQAKPMPGTSKTNTTRTSDPVPSDHSKVQPMDMEPYGPALPPRFTQKSHSQRVVHSDPDSDNLEQASDSYQANLKSQLSAEEDESSVHIRQFTQSQPNVPPEPQPQASSDPVFYREVDMNDLPSQYTEEVETFRQILDLPDPRETLPRSSTTVLGLDDEKGQQELRPRGPSAMLPLSPILKDAFRSSSKIFWPLTYLRVSI